MCLGTDGHVIANDTRGRGSVDDVYVIGERGGTRSSRRTERRRYNTIGAPPTAVKTWKSRETNTPEQQKNKILYSQVLL